MNYYKYKEACKNKVKGIHHWRNKCRKLQRSLQYNTDPNATVIHHLRDTEEQRKYNDEHYELWGHNLDGTFEYGKYVVFLTKEEHIEVHRLSEETKLKRNNKLKGHPVSDETRLKMSQSKLGHTCSESTKRKLSKSMKEFWDSVDDTWREEFCNKVKMSLSELDESIKSKLSEVLSSKEHRAKMSNILSELWKDENYRSKQKEAHAGYSPTEETRSKLSNSLKGRPSPMKGRHHSDETKKKLSESGMGRNVSEETRKKISDALKGSHHRPSPFAGCHFTDEQRERIKSKRREASELYKKYKEDGGELSWNDFCRQLKLSNEEVKDT